MSQRRLSPTTVIIPAFRSEETIEAAVESVLGQTLPADEILVVDDGSPDQTAARVARFGSSVRLLRKENGGPASARNLGIREACNPYIAFLDADDLWMPEKLQLQTEHMAAHPDCGLCCGDAWVFGEGVETGRKYGRVADRGRPALDFEGLLLGNPISTLTVLARREVLLSAGLFDEDRRLIAVEDYELWLRVAERSRIDWIDAPLGRYRVSAGSLSGTGRFLEGVTLALEKLRQRHPGAAGLRHLIRDRRSTLLLDHAWELIEQGRRALALRAIFEALALSPARGLAWKLFVKALLPEVLRARMGTRSV